MPEDQSLSAEAVVPVAAAPTLQPDMVQSIAPKKSNKKILFGIGGLLAAVVVAVGGYFLFNLITTPTQVKQQTTVTQSVYKDYSNSVDKLVANFLDDNSGSTPDAMERSLQQNEDMLKAAQKARKTLSEHLNNVTVAAAAPYKEDVSAYLDRTAEFLENEQKSIDLFKNYIEPMKKYQEITTESAGASNYMFSNPSKYLKEVAALISGEEEIVATFKDMKAEAPYDVSHKLFIETIENEVTFLQAIHDAVKDRDSDAIAEATKAYTESSQDNSEEDEKNSDAMEKDVKDMRDEIKVISDDVAESYSALQRKYNF